jgi:fused signal recognition particle receptor
MHVEVDEDMMDEIEEILITSDIGMETTMNIMEELRTYIKENAIVKATIEFGMSSR